MTRRSLVAGNWKMNGSQESVNALIGKLLEESNEINNTELVVFPPYLYIPMVSELLKKSHIAWGAQNMSQHAKGAFTGEVSAMMLRDYACQYVILGHSERRTIYHESNAEIKSKLEAAFQAHIKPILCVGETEEQRMAGKTFAVIKEQLSILSDAKSLDSVVIAYEPVWAIGTGNSANKEQAQEVHLFIREEVKKYNSEFSQKMRIIYGGSVTPENASQFFTMPDIDGALVGGASLDPNKFIEIGKQCSHSYSYYTC